MIKPATHASTGSNISKTSGVMMIRNKSINVAITKLGILLLWRTSLNDRGCFEASTSPAARSEGRGRLSHILTSEPQGAKVAFSEAVMLARAAVLMTSSHKMILSPLRRTGLSDSTSSWKVQAREIHGDPRSGCI